MEDLKTYFRGQGWQLTMLTDRKFEAHSKNYEVSLRSGPFVFHVKIEAIEDSSDKAEELTEDPIDFLERFLGTETGVTKVSSPDKLSETLRIIAAQIELQEISPQTAVKSLRRIFMASDAVFLRSSLEVLLHMASSDNIQKEELDALRNAMRSKGWKVSDSITSHGAPAIEIDISGIYKAEIYASSMQWEYAFSLRTKNADWKSGVTLDPIAEFRKFYRDLDFDVEDVESEDVESIRTTKTPTERNDSESPTIKPNHQ